MNNNVAVKLAAATLVLGVTMVGCTPSPEMSRPSSFSSKAPPTVVQAAELHAQALEAVRQGRLSEALTLTEQAVELEPRDGGYRTVLAALYLKNGRTEEPRCGQDCVLRGSTR